jgi:lipid II:glycine glycyltransferase (peptidoglycan interpeptide bridge formation enzyme)
MTRDVTIARVSEPPNVYWNSAHILQTPAWGELKSRFGWQSERVNDVLTLFRRLPLGLTVAYVPRGPQSDATDTWAALDAACRAQRAFLLKVEPDWPDSPEAAAALARRGFRPSPQTIQPRRTLLLDLSGSDDDVLARMKQKTRYNIRLATKKEVSARPARTPADLEAFSALLAVTGARDNFGVHAPAYYRAAYDLFHPLGQCELFLAEYRGEPLAGVMVFALGQRAWYFYGASSDKERSRMAPYLAQWEAIRWAKARGALIYDLWGVPDEDEAVLEAQFEARSDGLWGVYRFKRGWGGTLARTVGAWDKVYNPLLYRAYLLYLRLRRATLS